MRWMLRIFLTALVCYFLAVALKNTDKIFPEDGISNETDEVYVFYTHNHYNDFREYLNYYGGWGEMFGNVTGGGEFDSKSNYNPTPYVPTEYDVFLE